MFCAGKKSSLISLLSTYLREIRAIKEQNLQNLENYVIKCNWLLISTIILKYVYAWLSLCLHCSKTIVNVALEPNIYTVDNCWALEQQCCLLWRSFYCFSMKMTNNIQHWTHIGHKQPFSSDIRKWWTE